MEAARSFKASEQAHYTSNLVLPIFKGQVVQNYLTLEDGTDSLSWNVGTELPLCAA
jgi:hypothetical protein